MRKVLFGLLGFFFVPWAYALTTETEAPMEQVGPATVFVFLILVVAIIIGFFWWNARRDRKAAEESKTRN